MRAKLWTLFAFAGILATVTADSTVSTHQVPFGDLPKQAPAQVKGEDRTIYQIVSSNPHLTNVTRAINFSSGIVDLLNNTASGVTFFAVPDWAFRSHFPHKKHKKQLFYEQGLSEIDLPTVISLLEEHELNLTLNKDTDEEKKRRKEMLQSIITAILSYHILPQGYHSAQLSQNSTFATNLTAWEGSFDGQPLRIKVETSPFTHGIHVNLFSKVVKADIAASNGVVHIISHPLLLPSVFQELFLVPSVYSFFTSSIQRTGLTSFLERRWVAGKDGKNGSVEGATATTVFAPTNKAFKRLPFRLRVFLFSPFGERVLGKLLAYHVVPGAIVLSDYDHGVPSGSVISQSKPECFDQPPAPFEHSEDDVEDWWTVSPPPDHGDERDEFPEPPHHGHRGRDHDHDHPKHGHHGHDHPDHKHPGPCPPHRHPKHPHTPVYQKTLELPTLLPNKTLVVRVAQFEYDIPGRVTAYKTDVFVNGQKVAFADVPARNGAVHAIDRLLNPLAEHRRDEEAGVMDDEDESEDGEDKDGEGEDEDEDLEDEGEDEEDGGEDVEYEDEDGEWAGWEKWLVEWADEA